MVRIIPTKLSERLPSNADCVLIEPLPGGKFTAQGLVTNSRRPAFFNSSPFSSLDEAIASSKSWAEENEVAVIYVKAST